MDLLTLLERDTRLRRVSRRDGGEYAGPCPFCGGEDRFRAWPDAERPRWWCRRCERSGDAISYLREHDGLSYRDACTLAGKDAGGTSPTPHAGRDAGGTSEDAGAASMPNERWRAAAAAFCERAETALWSDAGRALRVYLRGRGLHELTIRAAGLGLHPAARTEPGDAWGLEDGLPVHLPAGLVVPGRVRGEVWRVNIRRASGEPRYQGVRGSVSALYQVDSLRADWPALLLEGELDALLVAQEARHPLVALATGSTTGARDLRWRLALGRATEVLVAFDADEPGDAAAHWWLEALPHSRRWRPLAKDPGEMRQAGLDLARWLAAGLGGATAPAPQDEPARMPAVQAAPPLVAPASLPAGVGRGLVAPASLPASEAPFTIVEADEGALPFARLVLEALAQVEPLAPRSPLCCRCGQPAQGYERDDSAWCFPCWDGTPRPPWQELLNCLPGRWRADMLARRAARAYHQAGRPPLVIGLYAGASPERHASRELWRRLGWALDASPAHFGPPVTRLFSQLARDGGWSLAATGHQSAGGKIPSAPLLQQQPVTTE